MGDMRNAHEILTWKPRNRRPLGRLRRKFGGDIEIDLIELEREGVDWTQLAQDNIMADFCELDDEPSSHIKATPFN
jgi:hypothetical protein